MAERRAQPIGARLPTLTEVVGEGLLPEAGPASRPLGADEEARVVEAVLEGLHRRMDLMFEYRLREALGPLLARLADALAQEAREELGRTLRDVVTRAVNQELSRRRPR